MQQKFAFSSPAPPPPEVTSVREKTAEKEVIVKIRCPYCKHLYKETLIEAPTVEERHKHTQRVHMKFFLLLRRTCLSYGKAWFFMNGKH
jgi:hypothetical protein